MKTHHTGSATQFKNPAVRVRDIATAHKYRGEKAKHQSFGHYNNVAEHIAKGTAHTEYRFALIDYRNGNEVIKTSTMSHQEAYRRNHTLKGTGIAWAKVDGSFRAKKRTKSEA